MIGDLSATLFLPILGVTAHRLVIENIKKEERKAYKRTGYPPGPHVDRIVVDQKKGRHTHNEFPN